MKDRAQPQTCGDVEIPAREIDPSRTPAGATADAQRLDELEEARLANMDIDWDEFERGLLLEIERFREVAP